MLNWMNECVTEQPFVSTCAARKTVSGVHLRWHNQQMKHRVSSCHDILLLTVLAETAISQPQYYLHANAGGAMVMHMVASYSNN